MFVLSVTHCIYELATCRNSCFLDLMQGTQPLGRLREGEVLELVVKKPGKTWTPGHLCVTRIVTVMSGDVAQVSQTCLLFTSRMKNFVTYRFRATSDSTVFLTSWSTNPPLKDSVSTSCVWVSEGAPSCTEGETCFWDRRMIVYPPSPFPPA